MKIANMLGQRKPYLQFMKKTRNPVRARAVKALSPGQFIKPGQARVG